MDMNTRRSLGVLGIGVLVLASVSTAWAAVIKHQNGIHVFPDAVQTQDYRLRADPRWVPGNAVCVANTGGVLRFTSATCGAVGGGGSLCVDADSDATCEVSSAPDTGPVGIDPDDDGTPECTFDLNGVMACQAHPTQGGELRLFEGANQTPSNAEYIRFKISDATGLSETFTHAIRTDGRLSPASIRSSSTSICAEFNGSGDLSAAVSGVPCNAGIAWTTVTGNTGSAVADTAGDTLIIQGQGAVSVTATDDPEGAAIVHDSLTAGFLTDAGVATLTCGPGTEGKTQVHDTQPLSYCDGGGSIRFASYGQSDGKLALANLVDNDTTAGECLLSGGAGGDPAYGTCPGTGTIDVKEDGGSVSPTATMLNFLSGFDLTDAPPGTDIVLDYTEDPPDLSTSEVTGTLPASKGGTGLTTPTADALMVGGDASNWVQATLPNPDCNLSTEKLAYARATNTFSCATDQSGGAGDAWTSLTGDTGSASAAGSEALSIVGGGIVSTAVTSNPDILTITGTETAAYDTITGDTGSATADAPQGDLILQGDTGGIVDFVCADAPDTCTATFATKTENTVLAGPTTGPAAVPAFRALVDADIPASVARSVGVRWLPAFGTPSLAEAPVGTDGQCTCWVFPVAGANLTTLESVGYVVSTADADGVGQLAIYSISGGTRYFAADKALSTTGTKQVLNLDTPVALPAGEYIACDCLADATPTGRLRRAGEGTMFCPSFTHADDPGTPGDAPATLTFTPPIPQVTTCEPPVLWLSTDSTL